MKLSIVVPAYNEENRIGYMLDRYLNYFSNIDAEFIIVLNGCRDNTIGIVKSFQGNFPDRIHIIDIPEAIGKGGALRQGFSFAQGDFIGFVDADASTEPGEFEKLIQAVNLHDGAFASRWKPGSQMLGRNLMRKITSFVFAKFVKIIFWMPFYDTQCGAKIFKKKVIKQVLPKLRVDNMATDVEIIYRLRQFGDDLEEIPTIWTDKNSSALLGSPLRLVINSLKMLMTLFTIRFTK